MAKHKALTQKEARFVAYRHAGKSKTESAILAGFSPASAHQQGYMLAKRPHIMAALEAKEAKLMNKLDISAERIRQERARRAFYNPQDYFHEDGSPKALHELTEAQAAAIDDIDVHASGTGKKKIFYAGKMRLASKDQNLTALEKIEGMYKQDDAESLPLNIHIHLD